MVSSPVLIFIRATNCPPCNQVMAFWDKILHKIKNDALLANEMPIVMIEGQIGVPLDMTHLPKSIQKLNDFYPVFAMVQGELWNEATKDLNADIDITEGCEVLGAKFNQNGQLIGDPNSSYLFTFPFGQQNGKKGLYEWIADSFVSVKIGQVTIFDEDTNQGIGIDVNKELLVSESDLDREIEEVIPFYIEG